MEPIVLPRLSDQKPLVSVISIAYNQELYIRDCLDGFLLQKTSFPVEVIIHDDASNDRTPEIIREYYERRPDLFHAIIQRVNHRYRNCQVLPPLFDIVQGKYIALCEGDDYWTDPLKLQKQVDFMEAHPDCTLIVHGHQKLYPNGQLKDFVLEKERFLKTEEVIENKLSIATNCCLIRATELDCNENYLKNAPVRDLPIRIQLALAGGVYYLTDIMSVYRVNAKNSWSSRMKGKKTGEVAQKMAQMYTEVDKISNNQYHDLINNKVLNYKLDALVFGNKHLDKQKFKTIKEELRDVYKARGLKFKIIVLLKRVLWY